MLYRFRFAILAATLAACHGDSSNDESDETDAEDTDESVTLDTDSTLDAPTRILIAPVHPGAAGGDAQAAADRMNVDLTDLVEEEALSAQTVIEYANITSVCGALRDDDIGWTIAAVRDADNPNAHRCQLHALLPDQGHCDYDALIAAERDPNRIDGQSTPEGPWMACDSRAFAPCMVLELRDVQRCLEDLRPDYPPNQ